MGSGPSLESLREAQVVEFGMLIAKHRRTTVFTVAVNEFPRGIKGDEVPVVVAPAMVQTVLQHMRGTIITGHYRKIDISKIE